MCTLTCTVAANKTNYNDTQNASFLCAASILPLRRRKRHLKRLLFCGLSTLPLRKKKEANQNASFFVTFNLVVITEKNAPQNASSCFHYHLVIGTKNDNRNASLLCAPSNMPLQNTTGTKKKLAPTPIILWCSHKNVPADLYTPCGTRDRSISIACSLRR